jgi:hypothetical protein
MKKWERNITKSSIFNLDKFYEITYEKDREFCKTFSIIGVLPNGKKIKIETELLTSSAAKGWLDGLYQDLSKQEDQ